MAYIEKYLRDQAFLGAIVELMSQQSSLIYTFMMMCMSWLFIVILMEC